MTSKPTPPPEPLPEPPPEKPVTAKPNLRLPPNCVDVTQEKLGKTIAVIGAVRSPHPDLVDLYQSAAITLEGYFKEPALHLRAVLRRSRPSRCGFEHAPCARQAGACGRSSRDRARGSATVLPAAQLRRGSVASLPGSDPAS